MPSTHTPLPSLNTESTNCACNWNERLPMPYVAVRFVVRSGMPIYPDLSTGRELRAVSERSKVRPVNQRTEMFSLYCEKKSTSLRKVISTSTPRVRAAATLSQTSSTEFTGLVGESRDTSAQSSGDCVEKHSWTIRCAPSCETASLMSTSYASIESDRPSSNGVNVGWYTKPTVLVSANSGRRSGLPPRTVLMSVDAPPTAGSEIVAPDPWASNNSEKLGSRTS